MSKQTQPRKRSNSLPIPKIEVSVYQSPDVKERDSLKNFIEVPEPKDISPVTELPFPVQPRVEEENVMSRRSSEKIKRKMKMADLKAFVETKLLSKSEKALEKIGQEDQKFTFHTAVRMISVFTLLEFNGEHSVFVTLSINLGLAGVPQELGQRRRQAQFRFGQQFPSSRAAPYR